MSGPTASKSPESYAPALAVWYGIAPALVYFGLAGAAVAILCGRQWGTTAVAADLMILLLVSIHAEWDLVTFLAPGAGRSDTDKEP